ncbi:MAG: AraC family transcriptional regulator [Myxococcales bacterium]
MITLAAQTARLLVSDARKRGIDVVPLLASAGVDEAALADPTARLPDTAVKALALGLLDEIDDPCWGLSLVDRIAPGTFGCLGYVFRNSETLGDGLRRLVRFARLINDVAAPTLDVDEAGARLTLRFDDPLPLPPSIVRLRTQCWLGAVVSTGRRITGTFFRPEQVAFPFPEPGSIEPYRTHFDAPLCFGEDQAGLRLSDRTLALPVTNPDLDLARIMEGYAEDLMAEPRVTDDLGLRVRQATSRCLSQGEASLTRIARELAMSPRSLQRKLRDEGISFSAVLDEVRRELAMGYLADSDLSIDQVAVVLGFSNSSAFAKAFRRWTGKAPSEIRRGG